MQLTQRVPRPTESHTLPTAYMLVNLAGCGTALAQQVELQGQLLQMLCGLVSAECICVTILLAQ